MATAGGDGKRAKPRKSDVARLSFAGGRYDAPGFPLDAVDELEKYQRLIVCAAEKIWREHNPKALRLPVRFADRVRLRLTRIDQGSVVPTLERAPELDLGKDDFDLLSESIAYVDLAFEQIVSGLKVPDDMPDEMLRVIRLFGVSFRGQERATFRWGTPQAVRYDQATRKQFLAKLAAERKTIYGALIGRIRMLDTAKKFILRDARDRPVEGSFTEASVFAEFHSVHQLQEDSDLVWLVGDFAASEDGEVSRIEDVTSVGRFTSGSSPWGLPLAELSLYPAGWMDGDGKRVSIDALLGALGLLDEISQLGIVRPSIFADLDGGVRLEWLTEDTHAKLTIHEDAQLSGYYLNVASGEERQLTLTSDLNAALRFSAETVG